MVQKVRQRKPAPAASDSQQLPDPIGGEKAIAVRSGTGIFISTIQYLAGIAILTVLVQKGQEYFFSSEGGIHIQFAQQQHNNNNDTQKATSNNKKHKPHHYVTVLLPSVVDENNVGRRLKAIAETWGPAANSIYIMNDISHFPEGMSTIITPEINTSTTPEHPQVLLLPSNMTENNAPRLKYVIERIYEIVNPDFCFFVNDHTFVIPEHLCNYLETVDPTQDLYAGHALQTKDIIFNSGAAGYILSRTTMRKLVEKWNEGTDPYCAPNLDDSTNKHTKWLQKSPGLFFASCLKNGLGISPIDTRDGKYHRFQAFPLTRVVSGDLDQWYLDKHTKEVAKIIAADESYTHSLNGPDCCSQSIVSFHYVEHLECRALFATRQQLTTNPQSSDKDLKDFMISQWPNTPKDVGGYSRGLPRPQNDQAWKALLETVRKISKQDLQQEC